MLVSGVEIVGSLRGLCQSTCTRPSRMPLAVHDEYFISSLQRDKTRNSSPERRSRPATVCLPRLRPHGPRPAPVSERALTQLERS